MSSSWYYYDRDLSSYEKSLNELEYAGVVAKPDASRRSVGFFTVGGDDAGPLTPDRINSILSSVRPPHGYDLLEPLPLPNFPHFPSRPDGPIPRLETEIARSISAIFGTRKPPDRSGFDPRVFEKEKRLKEKTEARRQEFQKKYRDIKIQFQGVQDRCKANDYESVCFLINLSHA